MKCSITSDYRWRKHFENKVLNLLNTRMTSKKWALRILIIDYRSGFLLCPFTCSTYCGHSNNLSKCPIINMPFRSPKAFLQNQAHWQRYYSDQILRKQNTLAEDLVWVVFQAHWQTWGSVSITVAADTATTGVVERHLSSIASFKRRKSPCRPLIPTLQVSTSCFVNPVQVKEQRCNIPCTFSSSLFHLWHSGLCFQIH